MERVIINKVVETEKRCVSKMGIGIFIDKSRLLIVNIFDSLNAC